MNLYDLLETYREDGVKAYHFQLHSKRVAGGNSIYYPNDWRQIDSELIVSKCATGNDSSFRCKRVLLSPPERREELSLQIVWNWFGCLERSVEGYSLVR